VKIWVKNLRNVKLFFLKKDLFIGGKSMLAAKQLLRKIHKTRKAVRNEQEYRTIVSKFQKEIGIVGKSVLKKAALEEFQETKDFMYKLFCQSVVLTGRV
jgi:hypothetical protein